MFFAILSTVLGLSITGLLVIHGKRAYAREMTNQRVKASAIFQTRGTPPYGWTTEPIHVFYRACLPHVALATVLWTMVGTIYYL